MNILYISSEAFPLIKTGGLGDVAGSLPNALLKKLHDVRLLLPAYPEVLNKITKNKVIATTAYYGLPASIIETRLPGSKLIVWLLDCPAVFNRPGGPYTDHHGNAWDDNALRFAVFCRCAVDIALDKLKLNWQPDIVHCNDWQSGLVPALLNHHRLRPATVFTIHNLAYQGVFEKQTFSDLQLPDELWHMDGLEFYDQLSFIKGGLAYADKITAVSPSYASEILSPEYGYGLNGLLIKRQQDLSGILNGIDHDHWNPGTDKCLQQKYNRRSINNKSANKTHLQEEFSLPIDATIPMIGIVSRLVEQKGFDIILQAIEKILTKPLQLVILGTGDTHYEIELNKWAKKYPHKLKVNIGYDECLAHRIEAASDIYLMPSTFEPCGLNQLYSLRYGTLPVVTEVGGLADTVTDTSQENINNRTANGFVVKKQTATHLLQALERAITLYKNTAVWRQLQINAMSCDFSWQASAEHYIELYELALKNRQ
ncbi:MAG: glycogen synthase GlgA [Gammaproteobacteria bacterium]|nr:glycogen synthase GlgA [Gammaproteobacteria bacterium]